MKNVSLFKTTVMVVTVAFASSFVNAKDKTETSQAEVVELAQQQSFSALVETLDSDKNGMLSQAEVSTNPKQFLLKEFSKIDVNQDEQIDEAEFNTYLTAIKGKTIVVVKNAT